MTDITEWTDEDLKQVLWLAMNTDGPAGRGVFDFNDWSVLMPLVVKYGIGISDTGDNCYGWVAADNTGIETRNKNPQRALAECLLLVLQAKIDD